MSLQIERHLATLGRMLVVTGLTVTLAHCAGRSEKQIEVQKRPVTAPSNTPTSPVSPISPIGNLPDPGPSSDPLPMPQNNNNQNNQPVVPVNPVNPVNPVQPVQPIQPVNPQPVVPNPVPSNQPQVPNPQPITQPIVQGTTNATITVTLNDGTTQQIQWNGLSDLGNAKWKIETVSQ